MTKTIVSSRQFNQDQSGAKSAAKKGPVIIADRGRPAHVLLSFEAYQKLTRRSAKFTISWPCPASPTSRSTRHGWASSLGPPG